MREIISNNFIMLANALLLGLIMLLTNISAFCRTRNNFYLG